MIIINSDDYFMHRKKENVIYIDVSSSSKISATFRKALRSKGKRDSYESDNRTGSICRLNCERACCFPFFLAEFN